MHTDVHFVNFVVSSFTSLLTTGVGSSCELPLSRTSRLSLSLREQALFGKNKKWGAGRPSPVFPRSPVFASTEAGRRFSSHSRVKKTGKGIKLNKRRPSTSFLTKPQSRR